MKSHIETRLGLDMQDFLYDLILLDVEKLKRV
jgi:hypothetical protein